jgi:hypothetical protein
MQAVVMQVVVIEVKKLIIGQTSLALNASP